MTPLDPFLDLHPPRLPATFAAFGWPETLAAFGLGLLLALAAFALLRPVLSRPRRPDPEADLAALQSLPREERLLAQARLLRRLGGTLPREVSDALYTGKADPDRLEPLLREALRRRGTHA